MGELRHSFDNDIRKISSGYHPRREVFGRFEVLEFEVAPRPLSSWKSLRRRSLELVKNTRRFRSYIDLAPFTGACARLPKGDYLDG